MQFKKHKTPSILSAKIRDQHYNPFKIPPDWDLAEKHGLAR